MVLEAQQLTRADLTPGCPAADVTVIPTRTVSPEPLFGEIIIPVRTCQCHGCGATCRPDDTALGVPETGAFTDAVRYLYAPLAAALPQRVANTLFARCTGVPLSSCGAPGIIERTAEDLKTWQAARERQETAAVADALAVGDGASDLRIEIAMDGVTAHLDGRWQPPKVAPMLVRQLNAEAEAPMLGAVLARRYVSVLGAADDLAVPINPALREAGWEHLPLGESLGDGAAWIWHLAEAHFPGVRQTLDYDHLSEQLSAFAPLLYPNTPAGAKAWVDQQLGALLTDRVGEVLGALKRLRPWRKAVREGWPS
jgi:hypothetical protein